MNQAASYCAYCGAPLVPGASFCERCGQPAGTGQTGPGGGPPDQPPKPIPPTAYPTPPPPPYQPPAQPAPAYRPAPAPVRHPPARRSPVLLWVIVGAGIVGFICLALVCGMVMFSRSSKSTTGDLAVSTKTPKSASAQATVPALAQATKPVTLATKAASPTAAKTAIPPSPTPTSPPPAPTETSITLPTQPVTINFFDDFSSLSTGWEQSDDAMGIQGYNEGAMYLIAEKAASRMRIALIPLDLPSLRGGYSIDFSARVVEGGNHGDFGVLCNFKDDKNYIYIGVTEGYYMIGKYVDGSWIPLTEPAWMPSAEVQSQNGLFHVVVMCGEGAYGLQVNDFSQPVITDETFSGGQVALFASSWKNAVQDGEYFFKVLFDDFSISGNP